MNTITPSGDPNAVGQAVVSPDLENAIGRTSQGGSDNSSNDELSQFNLAGDLGKKLDLKSYLNAELEENVKPTPSSRVKFDFENIASNVNTSSIYISPTASRYLSVSSNVR